MIQFYAPQIEENGLLPESESGHCCRVLRMKEGDKIYVTDGKGRRFLCEIIDANPKRTSVRILQIIDIAKERDYNLTLAVAPTKNSDRIEWMVEKAVEIGVDKIVLLRCNRSERKFQRADRLKRIMVSAMNQSLDVYLPELEEIVDFDAFISSCSEETQKFFGYCSSEYPRIDFVKVLKPGGEVVVMIGPEGDFTPDEVKAATEKNFIPVTLGNKRLRTETAGVYCACAVNVINQLS